MTITTPADETRAERAIAEFLEALGYDLRAPEFAETPRQVVQAYLGELLVGERIDVRSLVEKGALPSTSKSLVVVTDIAVCTLCPHHLLPAQGRATVAYIPGARLLGLGTVAALVNAYSRRLTLQERITDSVVLALMQEAGAQGAYCRLELQHGCLSLRGQRQTSAKVVTSKLAGSLLEPEGARELELALRDPHK